MAQTQTLTQFYQQVTEAVVTDLVVLGNDLRDQLGDVPYGYEPVARDSLLEAYLDELRSNDAAWAQKIQAAAPGV